MGTVINSDFSSTTTRTDGKVLNLASHNPFTGEPFTSNAEVEAFVASIIGEDKYFLEPIVPSYRTTLTPVEFKMMLTVAERVAVKQAAEAGDLVLADFLELLNDPRLKSVILTHPDNIAAMNYLVSLSILTEARAATILQGMLE
jgi:hypothetical protein